MLHTCWLPRDPSVENVALAYLKIQLSISFNSKKWDFLCRRRGRGVETQL